MRESYFRALSRAVAEPAAWLLLSMLVLGLLVLQAAPLQHLVALDVLQDPHPPTAFEEASKGVFMPSGRVVARGFTDAPNWVRLRVRPAADGGDLHLRLVPAFLDEIVLFEPDPARPGAWRSRTMGDRYPYLARDYLSPVPTFVIRPSAPETTYYIRFTTTSTAVLAPQVVSSLDSARIDLRLNLQVACFMVFMLALLLWALRVWLHERHPVMGAFVVFQFAYALQIVLIAGYLPLMVPEAYPTWADQIGTFMICLHVFAVALLYRLLLREYGINPRLLRVFDFFLMLFPVQLLLIFLGHSRPVLQASALAMMFLSVFAAAVSFTASRDLIPSRRALQAVMVLQAVVLVWSRVAIFASVQPGEEWLLNPRVLGFGQGLFACGLIAMMLAAREKGLARLAREAEQARERRAREIEHMNSELELRAEAVEAASRAHRTLMAAVNHELRTPLNAVLGYAERLGHSALDSAQRGHVAGLLQGGLKLRGMIDDILELTGSVSGARDRQQVEFSPVELLTGLQAEFRDRAAAQGLGLALEISPALPRLLRGDRESLRKALARYLANAIRFTSTGEITLRAHPESQPGDGSLLLRLEVQDTGVGIEAGLREQILQDFSPVDDNATPSYTGAGLGLSIVRHFAQLMGGTTGFESTPGKGSCFWLTARLECPRDLPHAGTDGAASQVRQASLRAARVPRTDADRALAMAAIDKLLGLLQADDAAIQRRFPALLGAMRGCCAAAPLEVLSDQVRRFDFEAAMVTLGGLRAALSDDSAAAAPPAGV